ncbi:hypothetical protein NX801_05000 [Streptomyces sp. LP05-1]|uniref:Integral membrane protein n=1 Tax=Streptomyces pyxinae TaxID=2970734 RepID=A0ABT2CCI4_9ACTN|nr:hypothetical protein [Streptomyces sp. LP05-1]MCS0635025.1 hypothetical protein [Streptomyces sp. LP05-1]
MSTRVTAGSAVRRLLRQDRADTWAVRLLPRIVFGLAAGYTVWLLASQGLPQFVAVCAVAGLTLIGWSLRRRGQLLLALCATAVTAAVTGYLAAVADIARGAGAGALSGQAVFGYWALAGMALLGAWMVRDHPGRRGVTVLAADVVLVITSGVGTVVPGASVLLGFAGVVAVLLARGGGLAAARRRLRRGGKPPVGSG